MEFNLMSILTLVIGFFVGFLCVAIFMAIKHNQSENKANKLIEDAKKEADKHKRDTLMEIKEESYRLKQEVEKEIKEMPNYFADYDTTVHFITQEELNANHSGIPHGGFVIRSGNTGWNNEHKHIIEYRLKLDSNPEFTASVLTAYARAAYRMNAEGMCGCKTAFDVAPAYLCQQSGEELRRQML